VTSLSPRYVRKTDDDLRADLAYCRALSKDMRAPASVRDAAKDEEIAIRFELDARKAVRS